MERLVSYLSIWTHDNWDLRVSIRILNQMNNNGNLILKNTGGVLTTYTWDQENRLTAIASPTTGTTTYLYSDDGHRQATINSSGTTNFVYDGDIILQETNAGGVTQVQYTQGPGTWGELSAQKRGSAIQILASDDRQNVRLVLGSSGAILDYNQYKAFLEQLNTPTQTNPFLGWGNDNVYAEVLGLLRTGHRLIVPNTARFLNPDPLGFAGGDNNLFRLVKNNPLAWTDPSGNAPVVPSHANTPLSQSWFSALGSATSCLSAPPAPSSSPLCDKYGCAKYPVTGTNLECFCKCAGDSPWSDEVRGCLACMYPKGINITRAHEECYREATTHHWFPGGTIAIC